MIEAARRIAHQALADVPPARGVPHDRHLHRPAHAQMRAQVIFFGDEVVIVCRDDDLGAVQRCLEIADVAALDAVVAQHDVQCRPAAQHLPLVGDVEVGDAGRRLSAQFAQVVGCLRRRLAVSDHDDRQAIGVAMLLRVLDVGGQALRDIDRGRDQRHPTPVHGITDGHRQSPCWPDTTEWSSAGQPPARSAAPSPARASSGSRRGPSGRRRRACSCPRRSRR